MADRLVSAIFSGMVRRLGGVEAATAVLAAHTGAASKGTVSKMCTAGACVTIEAARAIEDALGEYPLTRWMHDRTERAAPTSGAGLKALLADSSLANGAAHAALIRALSPDSPSGENLSQGERAEVLSSMRHARDVLDGLIAEAEGME
ncbi:MAG: hypothetical protein EP318_15525 [Rhodobacteraceae bacterium]|nr:MAG: hypothetical protein EP318_15525 [Paracoccaceae bacterium]